ncbi:hypothetical protein [Roseobacter sp. OBYS 0001]|uniref:phage tail terminator protein n=1 Tax=Roseobacter sp. OBYS 0001 TaxID=882651 RepID=UPI001BB8E680|nr:hypothetical protein [Roseobacter sp. OBYS 0001]GIT85406.1 hypothetical protein ROBYS_04220 [Roseobacter sp. OBYS 0001]
MIEDVIARLQAEIAELDHRVEGAGAFAEMMRAKRLPQHTPAAHVLPLGIAGRAADSSAGAFTQMLEETVGIILTIRDQGAMARRVLGDLRGFIFRIIEAIAGWGPTDSVGVFRFARGTLVSSSAGTFVYQMDFTIADQLRIF